MICLNSKVYHIWTDDPSVSKTSCKGVNKKRNELVKDDFLNIINNPRTVHMVENAGFIRDGLDTKTYTQSKRGLNYFYGKRIVLDDGVTGIKPIQPNEARNILKQIDKVGTQLRELVDIS